MGQGIGAVLPFAIGLAVIPVPIIAVILMLFSRRAKVNGPVFLGGWVIALAVVAGAVYAISAAADVDTGRSASDSVSWLKLVLGVVFLLVAVRQWKKRPAPGVEPAMPGWMQGIEGFTPGKAFAVGALLAGANPKNLVLIIGAATSLAQTGVSTTDAVVSLVVFVVVGSLAIAAPVLYYLLGGAKAKAQLDELEGWLKTHNAAVMVVVLVIFGVVLIANALPPLSR